MNKCKVKLLDIVRTPKGQLAVVTEISEKDWGGLFDIAVEYIGKKDKFGEGNAWFDINELVKIDSVSSLVSRILVDNLEYRQFYSDLVTKAMEELDNE